MMLDPEETDTINKEYYHINDESKTK